MQDLSRRLACRGDMIKNPARRTPLQTSGAVRAREPPQRPLLRPLPILQRKCGPGVHPGAEMNN